MLQIGFAALILMSGIFIPQNALYAQDSLKVKHQGQHHQFQFVDKDGDGYNDNAPDHDGDGIPNGLDPDWQKLQKAKKQGKKQRFIDLDGDGINDLLFSGEGPAGMKEERMGKEKGGAMGIKGGKGQRKKHGAHGK